MTDISRSLFQVLVSGNKFRDKQNLSGTNVALETST